MTLAPESPGDWLNGLTTIERNARISNAYATRRPPPDAFQVRAITPRGHYEQTVFMTGVEMVNALRVGWALWDAFSPGWEWVLTRNGLLCQVDRKAEALAFYKQERYVHI